MVDAIDQYTINYNIPILQINISACGNLNQTNSIYILNRNISSGGTCFTIGANNITLEGNGYIVNYSTTGAGYGIVDTGGYDNIIVRNLTITEKSTTATYSHGIYFKNVSDSNADNVSISTQAATSDGIYLDSSGSNKFSNFNVFTQGTSAYGIYTYLSGSNDIRRFNITTLGSNSNGIYIKASDNNNYSNLDISTFGTAAHGIYLNGNYNSLTNTNMVSSGQGIYINSSGSNMVKDSSIISKLSNDYYLQNIGTTNSFINTNFTTRNLYLYDNSSKFNYNDGIWLNTTQIVSPSTTLVITRKLLNWNQTNVSWQETVSASRRLNYGMSGLLSGKHYSVWNGTIIAYNLSTDNNGNLPVFSINLTASTKLIKVLSS